MSQDLPAWVAELTDPRRANTLDELADRLVPLAEHSIDVSRRLQALLSELNEPFKREAVYDRVERLKNRADEAFGEVTREIVASGQQRLDRVLAAWRERAEGEPEITLRRRLDADVIPALRTQERTIAEEVGERTAVALEVATQTLLARVEQLAVSVTSLIHDVLPLAHEGLGLAGRISGLSAKVRGLKDGRLELPEPLREAAAGTADSYNGTVARLELEWATLGSQAAIVRAALRAAEETAFSQVTAEMTECVEELAQSHIKVLNDAENRAMTLVDELIAG
jgi:rRNA-processing protein FCF1